MKKFISAGVLIAIFIMGVFTVINRQQKKNNPAQDEKLKIVVSIFPQYDFTRQITKGLADIEMLIAPGAESHSFEPTPQDIIKIKNSDIFIYIGGESDAWIDKILKSMDASDKKIIALMNLIDPVEEELVEGMQDDEQDAEEGGEEKEYDEHIWTSPKNAIEIVKSLCEILQEADPKNARAYQKNTSAYIKQLENLDEELQSIAKGGKRKTIVVGDRFPFRYLADELKLQYFAAFPGCSTETQPSAKTIAFLINKVKTEKIPVVFYIEFSNQKIADIIVERSGAKKLLLHSAHNVSKTDFEKGISYLDIMKTNAEHLKEALWL
ncbi:MAG: metal ABC transporter substrate-binding protein [Elusimicrobiota bacterium]|jgi:zinc transport system substrate-binding protein|nr:metal ABC transporter substrate-binding protein [Elusimicrobiota bacterium]